MTRTIIFLIIFSFSLFAQNFSGGFNFNLGWNDSSSQKFLPHFPINELKDFISINDDGHFSLNNESIRFWGTNLVADGAFPDKNKTPFIAGRLRKMGFNLIRLHHIDNPWSDGSLFNQGGNTRNLNPVTLDKLEYLISELRKNGIYVNVNLNVSRTFKESDGVENAGSIPDYGKGVTLFDPYLIFLQKEYAQQLLTHVNPYTGKSLVDDPVMAMVEIINENSLYRMWHDNKLKTLSDGGSLILRHSTMLDSMWNEYLLNKYSSNENLAIAWNEGSSSGSSLNHIINGDFESGLISSNWIMELHEGASAQQAKDNSNPFAGVLSAKITVTNVTGTDWHIQWKQVNLKVKKDSLYTIEFAARADGNKKITVTAMRETDPWTYYGGKEFTLATDWNVYSFTFKANEDNNNTRLSFSFNNNTGTYWFDEIEFGISGKTGLHIDENLDSRTVKRMDYTDCVKYTDQRIKDISSFYIKIQDDFFADMRGYLKNTLGVKVPIVGTNWNVGPGDLVSQSKMDYVDNHAYWDHPQFPNEPWSATDWLISNKPIVTSKSGFSIADLFAGNAMTGKPYTVSEINDCFPNRYQTEALIFTTAYFSFHDADAVMFFDYNGGKEWIEDKVASYFSLHRNNAMMALMPSCAYAYRNNLISQAKEIVKLNYTSDFINLLPKNENYNWAGPSFYPKRISLIHSVKNESFDNLTITDFSVFQEPVNPYVSDTEEIIWNTDGMISVGTGKFIGAAGFLNNFSNSVIGNLEVKEADGFGTLTWMSLTNDSLSITSKSELTVSTTIQNTGMVWEGDYTFHNNWGKAPTQMKPLTLQLRLNIYADSIYVYPLDNSGKERISSVQKYFPFSNNLFDVTIDLNSSKTLWFGIEKYGNGKITSTKKEDLFKEFKLNQNYPNPFNSTTTIEYTVPNRRYIKIAIYDLLGKEIAVLKDGYHEAGDYRIYWNGENNAGEKISSGIFFIRFSAGDYSVVNKIVMLK